MAATEADNRARTFLFVAVFFGAVPGIGLLAIAVVLRRLLAGPGRLSGAGVWVVAFGLIATAGAVLVNVKVAKDFYQQHLAVERLHGFDPKLPLKGGDRAQNVFVTRAQLEAGDDVAVTAPSGHELKIALPRDGKAGDYWTFDEDGELDAKGRRGTLFVVLQIK
jgi:hypothetical protein